MSNATQTDIGAVVSLWRYPVKSMMGEEQSTAQLSNHGLVGDRAYALVDSSDGKVATAKNPRKWPNLFAFQAALVEPLGSDAPLPPVRITLPDGTLVSSEKSDSNQALSKALKRQVTLAATQHGQVTGVQSSGPASWKANSEEYWPDIDGLNYRDTVTEFALPTGTFFDCATVHLLTTATLSLLQDFYPQGRFEVQRFRPNIVVDPGVGEKGFAENAWIGQTLAIGDEVHLNITGPCGRCVMTTLTQGDLPKDSGVLRTVVQHNQGNVGVYAAVVRGGTIRRGDRVKVVA
ncbi:MAG: MOSC domain-containing protein [Acidobacteria bacterium]|nr:MOSC domain-containing protein [Acidobacteriota bacterium]MCI0719284.1 MOSC domain-containing protein [Acidobacteriota bacterium]